MRERWITFYLNGRELCSYTVRGTFPGEMEATKKLLAAYEGCSPEDITVQFESTRK